MCKELSEDTEKVDIQQAILEELRKLGKQMDEIATRIDNLEDRVEQVVTDLNTVHSLQRTYTSRLATIEQICVDRPLATATPAPSRPPGGDGRIEP